MFHESISKDLSLAELKADLMHNNLGTQSGNWLWWFWLFFMDNQETGEHEQLMILWSSKNDDEISCNDLVFHPVNHKLVDGKPVLDGATAVWYFDGKKMHEDFILERSDIVLDESNVNLSTISKNKSDFFLRDNKEFVINIDRGDIKLDLVCPLDDDKFNTPNFNKNSYFNGKYGYEIININRLGLKGTITKNGKSQKVKGSSYLQKVLVNSIVPPWYWGIYHFADGSLLTYFDVHVTKYPLTKSHNKNIEISSSVTFYHKPTGNVHKFNNLKIKRVGEKNPKFFVTSKSKTDKISFTVDSISEAAWKFRKKRGPLTTKLTYNEYPSFITDFKLEGSENLTLADLGRGVGNAEHTWGVLI